MHRTGKVCEACMTPLKTPDSAILMDRDGRSYHVICWVKLGVTKPSSKRQPAQRKRLDRRTPPTPPPSAW
jgi:hypothetical protein